VALASNRESAAAPEFSCEHVESRSHEPALLSPPSSDRGACGRPAIAEGGGGPRCDEGCPGNAQPRPVEFAALCDDFLGCPPGSEACRSSQRLWDGVGEQPELVGRSSVRGWWRGQCPRASPIAHGDDRSAEAPWSLSPRGDRPPHATAYGPGWSPPSSRGFRAPTVPRGPVSEAVGRSPRRAAPPASPHAR
jgi:hypothetical protein